VNLRRRIEDAQRDAPDVLVFDRFLYDQLATLPLENAVARRYATFLLSLVPKPDLPIILDAQPEEARRRKPEYPLDFLHRYRATYLLLGELAKLTVIPPQDPEGVHSAIVRALESSTGIVFTSQAIA
jgi:thymidylate kinase